MSIKLFDDKLHTHISGALDRTEDKLVRDGVCDAEYAADVLTTKYIACCAGIIRGGNAYLPNDEWIGAEIFLTWLGDAQFKRLSPRTQTRCAVHLTNHTAVYFPNYHAALRLTLVHVLHSICGHEKIEKHGVVLLAAATLPGARNDIRRELRHRGASGERLLVQDDVYQQRVDRSNGRSNRRSIFG